MNCNKCIHLEMCKFTDMLPEIQKQFPFISDFTCKFNEKSTGKTAPMASKPIETVTFVTEKPKRTKKVKEEKVKNEVVLTEVPSNEKEDDKEMSFTTLSISNLFDERIVKKLNGLGCNIIKDIYKVDKSKLTAADITVINMKLSTFNQPEI